MSLGQQQENMKMFLQIPSLPLLKINKRENGTPEVIVSDLYEWRDKLEVLDVDTSKIIIHGNNELFGAFARCLLSKGISMNKYTDDYIEISVWDEVNNNIIMNICVYTI